MLKFKEKSMKTGLYQTSTYDSSLRVDTSDLDKVVLSATTADKADSVRITLDRSSIEGLVEQLDSWLQQQREVEYVSANQKFSWFNFRSED